MSDEQSTPVDAYDVIVIGAGMAGASVAYEISDCRRVLLLEREQAPGYHATGRSAAAFIPSYEFANSALRTLTSHSLSFLQSPPPGFAEVELLHRRGLLTIATPARAMDIESEYAQLDLQLPGLCLLDRAAISALIPSLCSDCADTGLLETNVFDIDVNALHQGYLRGMQLQGGRMISGAEVELLSHDCDCWSVETSKGTFHAPVVVNAAGAWSDEVAEHAGVEPIGLMPLRRTAVLLDPPAGVDVSDWPLVLSSDESFYFKPDAGLLFVSPADEHPSAPMDAQPHEIDIARAVDYAQRALALDKPRVRSTWAGLRSFVTDRTPVIGFEPGRQGFFWLAGQGGHGIQTGPASARLAASLLLQQPLPYDLAQSGFDTGWVSPARLRQAAGSDQ